MAALNTYANYFIFLIIIKMRLKPSAVFETFRASRELRGGRKRDRRDDTGMLRTTKRYSYLSRIIHKVRTSKKIKRGELKGGVCRWP